MSSGASAVPRMDRTLASEPMNTGLNCGSTPGLAFRPTVDEDGYFDNPSKRKAAPVTSITANAGMNPYVRGRITVFLAG